MIHEQLREEWKEKWSDIYSKFPMDINSYKSLLTDEKVIEIGDEILEFMFSKLDTYASQVADERLEKVADGIEKNKKDFTKKPIIIVENVGYNKALSDSASLVRGAITNKSL